VDGVLHLLLKQHLRRQDKDVDHIQSILRQVEIKLRRDIEDKEGEMLAL